MPIEPSQRLGRGDIPEEDGLVSADGDEFGVVARDGEVEDFVAVSRVCLDVSATRGVEEADFPV